MAVKTETKPQIQPNEKDKNKVNKTKFECPVDPACQLVNKDGTCGFPGRCTSAPRYEEE